MQNDDIHRVVSLCFGHANGRRFPAVLTVPVDDDFGGLAGIVVDCHGELTYIGAECMVEESDFTVIGGVLVVRE